MSWVSWEKVLAAKDRGGMGVGSYFALTVICSLNGFGVFCLKNMCFGETGFGYS